MMDFSKLNFGAPAAERDITFGLSRYFVESEAFTRLRERKKQIIIGSRGSGKSALFKILAERKRKAGTLVIELNPENYSYEMLSSVLRRENEGAWANHAAFATSWKFYSTS